MIFGTYVCLRDYNAMAKSIAAIQSAIDKYCPCIFHFNCSVEIQMPRNYLPVIDMVVGGFAH